MTYRAMLVSGLLIATSLIGCARHHANMANPFAGANAAALTLQSTPASSSGDFGLPSNAWPRAGAHTAAGLAKSGPPRLDDNGQATSNGQDTTPLSHSQNKSTGRRPQYYVATGQLKPVPDIAPKHKKSSSDGNKASQ